MMNNICLKTNVGAFALSGRMLFFMSTQGGALGYRNLALQAVHVGIQESSYHLRSTIANRNKHNICLPRAVSATLHQPNGLKEVYTSSATLHLLNGLKEVYTSSATLHLPNGLKGQHLTAQGIALGDKRNINAP